MAVEVYANNASSTLNGSITNVATTLIVISATAFSSTGNFRIIIDSELLLVTGVSGTTFTISRGMEGTAAVSHTTGAPVTQILTAGGLKAGIIDPIQSILNGTTAGTATSSMPNQQTTYKKFICFLNGYQNSTGTAQTISFPTAFTNTPIFTTNIDPQCTLSTSALTLPVNMGAIVTGYVLIEGW